jgi:hypothetical protein
MRRRAKKQPGRIKYKNVPQTDVSIPVSFKGFNEALDAFQKALASMTGQSEGPK